MITSFLFYSLLFLGIFAFGENHHLGSVLFASAGLVIMAELMSGGTCNHSCD